MAATVRASHNEPLLRPTPNDLALAPELGVLAALDATLATAAYQLMAEHPDLGLDSLARGDLPSPEACKANHLCVQIHGLRQPPLQRRASRHQPERRQRQQPWLLRQQPRQRFVKQVAVNQRAVQIDAQRNGSGAGRHLGSS